ncbi:hypothetical protein ACOMHN_017002 [Nucella lapillus]
MKDIASVCSQNEVRVVDDICELSPPCVTGHLPATPDAPPYHHHHPPPLLDTRGSGGFVPGAYPDRYPHPPPPWMCSGSPSNAGFFGFSPSPQSRHSVSPSPSTTTTTTTTTLYPPARAGLVPSPTGSSPSAAYPSCHSGSFAPSPIHSVSPSPSSLYPPSSASLARSPSRSGSSPSGFGASASFSPSPSHPVSPANSLAGFATSMATSFSSSSSASSQHQVSMSALIPSPTPSMFSQSPSPSASFSPSPPTPFTSSPNSASTFVPSPSSSKCGAGLEDMSQWSPPVTIKTEDDDSSYSVSPQPPPLSQGAPPALSQGAPPALVVPHMCLGATSRSASPGKTVSGSLLPPCKICLDRASGFHYGLNTCEACKGFFRRSLKRGVSYVCARSSNCDVTGEKRNMCGYCRYQKCIALGMSKKAIKTGRYTHAKRTKDTLEIKRLMRADSPSEEDEVIDFEAIIAQVVQAHDEFVISSTRIPMEVIRKKQLEKVEEINLNETHYGNMKQVSPNEHQEIYVLTGIDIDNRRELMKFHVKNSEKWIRGYINFAKKLPGFRELTLGDQANLVKYSRIEFWFLGSYPGYNSELGLAVMPNGRCFTRTEMCSVWQNKYIDVSYELSQKLQKLQVTPEEMIIIKAICLTAGDRCMFANPDMVARIQWRMIRCLQHLLHKRCTSHSQFVSIFSKVFMGLTDLRDLNEAEYQTIQSTQLYQLFTEHPLIMEVLPY